MHMSRKRSLISGIALITGAALVAACGGAVTFQDQAALSIQGTPPAPPPPPPPEPKKEEPPPKPKRVEVRDNKIEIREKIQFDKAKATIKAESHDLLNEIAQVIKDNPHIRKIAIEGHTSSEGGADFNRKLSDNRAKAVMVYLVAKGIEQDKLKAKGFGPDKPIAPNDTEENREKNRRVEFNITEQDVTKKKVEVDPATGKEKVLDEDTKTVKDKKKKKDKSKIERPSKD
jgi:OOP family OmpA-OmpF porin